MVSMVKFDHLNWTSLPCAAARLIAPEYPSQDEGARSSARLRTSVNHQTTLLPAQSLFEADVARVADNDMVEQVDIE